MEYLKKARASKNLRFWLACSSLLEMAETNETVPYENVRNVQQVTQLRADDQSRLQVDEKTLHVLESVGSHTCMDDTLQDIEDRVVSRNELISFVLAQEQVYAYLQGNHYRLFTFSEYYRSYIQHSSQLGTTASKKKKPVKNSKGTAQTFNTALGPNVSASWRSQGSVQPDISGPGYIAQKVKDLVEEIRRRESESQDPPHMSPTGRRKTASKADELKALQEELRRLEHHEERTHEWMSHIQQWDAHVEGVQQDDNNSQESLAIISVNRIDQKGQGWIVTRTHSEFVTLHNQLRQCCDWLPTKPPWKLPSAKIGFFGVSLRKNNAAETERQRSQLGDYLKSVLKDEKLCFSEELFRFLSLSDNMVHSAVSPQKASPAQADQANSLGRPNSVSRLSSVGSDRALSPSMLDDDSKSDSIAEPLYALVSEVFVLKGAFKWVRRQFVNFVQLAYGRTINGYVKEVFESHFTEEQMVEYLTTFRDTMFPDDYVEEEPRTFSEMVQCQSEAKKRLLANLPDLLTSFVGQDNARQGAELVFEVLQTTHKNKHLFYMLLEKVLEQVLKDEMDWRDRSDELVEVDISLQS